MSGNLSPPFFEGTGTPAVEALDLTWVTSDNSNRHWVYCDINHHNSGILGSALYIEITTFKYHEIDGLVDSTASRVVIAADLEDNRYRIKWLSGDAVDDTSVALTLGVWSAWRGGAVAPTQKDSWNYRQGGVYGTGSQTGRFQIQVEEPDGSETIIVDRTISLTLTVT